MALAIVMKSHVTVDKHTVGGGRKGLSKEVECRQAKLEIGLLVVVLVSDGEVLQSVRHWDLPEYFSSQSVNAGVSFHIGTPSTRDTNTFSSHGNGQEYLLNRPYLPNV
jgi:hypothetical protein